MSKLNANKSTPKTKMNLRSTGSMSTPTNPDRQCQEVLKNLLSGVNEEGESLIDIIRKVVKEELLNHEIKIKELIDTNVKHTNERLDQLSSDINNLKENLEFTEQDIDNKLVKVENELKDLKTDVKAIENDLLNADKVSDKLAELEDWSHRNNLRIDGIEESPDETWETCENKIKDIIKEKLDIETDVELDRCHRIGKKRGSRPRTLICRFTKFKDKQCVLSNARKLRGTNIYIYENFSQDTMELRKYLWEQVLEYRRQRKFAYLNYRNIVVKDNNRHR